VFPISVVTIGIEKTFSNIGYTWDIWRTGNASETIDCNTTVSNPIVFCNSTLLKNRPRYFSDQFAHLVCEKLSRFLRRTIFDICAVADPRVANRPCSHPVCQCELPLPHQPAKHQQQKAKSVVTRRVFRSQNNNKNALETEAPNRTP